VGLLLPSKVPHSRTQTDQSALVYQTAQSLQEAQYDLEQADSSSFTLSNQLVYLASMILLIIGLDVQHPPIPGFSKSEWIGRCGGRMAILQQNNMAALRADGTSDANSTFIFAQHIFGALYILDRFNAISSSRDLILQQDCSEYLLQYGLTVGIDSEAYQLCRELIRSHPSQIVTNCT
jgi:hypothetical protein